MQEKQDLRCPGVTPLSGRNESRAFSGRLLSGIVMIGLAKASICWAWSSLGTRETGKLRQVDGCDFEASLG